MKSKPIVTVTGLPQNCHRSVNPKIHQKVGEGFQLMALNWARKSFRLATRPRKTSLSISTNIVRWELGGSAADNTTCPQHARAAAPASISQWTSYWIGHQCWTSLNLPLAYMGHFARTERYCVIGMTRPDFRLLPKIWANLRQMTC